MKKHEHGGRGSGFKDPDGILRRAGIKAGETVLDLGCGKGLFSIAASRLVGKEGRVYAVDIDEASVAELRREIAGKNITNIETITADAVRGIPVPPASADTCIMSNVLHGFVANGEFAPLAENLRMAMKSGGRIVVIEFKKNFLPFGPPRSMRLSREDVESLFKPLGYTISGDFKVGFFHYGLVLSHKKQGLFPEQAG